MMVRSANTNQCWYMFPATFDVHNEVHRQVEKYLRETRSMILKWRP